MTKTIIVFFSFLTLSSFSQKGWTCDYTKNDSLRKILDSIVELPLPNLLCVDDDLPFLRWKQEPLLVTFNLYDRWGSPVLCYDKPDMMMRSDKEERKKLREDTLYYFFVLVITSSGKKLEFCGQLQYHGYCRCG